MVNSTCHFHRCAKRLDKRCTLCAYLVYVHMQFKIPFRYAHVYHCLPIRHLHACYYQNSSSRTIPPRPDFHNLLDMVNHRYRARNGCLVHVPPPQKTCRFHFKKPPYTHPRFTQCSFSLGHVFSSATQQTALRNATPRPVPSRAFGPIVDSWRVPDHPSARPARSWVSGVPMGHWLITISFLQNNNPKKMFEIYLSGHCPFRVRKTGGAPIVTSLKSWNIHFIRGFPNHLPPSRWSTWVSPSLSPIPPETQKKLVSLPANGWNWINKQNCAPLSQCNTNLLSTGLVHPPGPLISDFKPFSKSECRTRIIRREKMHPWIKTVTTWNAYKPHELKTWKPCHKIHLIVRNCLLSASDLKGPNPLNKKNSLEVLWITQLLLEAVEDVNGLLSSPLLEPHTPHTDQCTVKVHTLFGTG